MASKPRRPPRMTGRPAKTMRTPRGTFRVTDMSREQMEAAGYGFHHESEDGKYLIMANGSRAFRHPQRSRPRTYRTGEADRPGGGANEGTLCEGDRPWPPCAASGGGRRYCRLLSLLTDPVGLVLNDEGQAHWTGPEPVPPGRAWGDLRHCGGHLPGGGPGAGEFRVPAPGHDRRSTLSNSSGRNCSPASTGRCIRSRGAGKPAAHGRNDRWRMTTA